MIDRRTFLAGTGAVLLAAPLAGEAQQPRKAARLGRLDDAPSPRLEAFRRRNNIAPASPVRINDQLLGSGISVAEKKNGSISPVVSMAPALTSPSPAKVP